MVLVSTSLYGKWKKYWQRKRYQQPDREITVPRKKMKIIRLGGSPRRVWKVKAMPKLRILENDITSPLKLLSQLKNAYAELMLRAGNTNAVSDSGDKRVPNNRKVKSVYPSDEFEKRLVYEISKNFLANRELNTM